MATYNIDTTITNKSNYLILNGKKIELTEEQIQELQKEYLTDIFARNIDYYYNIDSLGYVNARRDYNLAEANRYYEIGNYCSDKNIMENRALQETLNRLLWRYSMQHGGDEIDWTNIYEDKFYIYFDCDSNIFDINTSIDCYNINEIYFKNEQIAKAAIEEIIKPFLEKNNITMAELYRIRES